MKQNQIILLFEYYLSRPPCEAGIRLRSEPELGRIFGESRQKMRRALDDLVKREYLTRKHGSGTFVRKAFSAEECIDQAAARGLSPILPEQIFLPQAPGFALTPEKQAQRLRIGLTGDPGLLNWTNLAIFEAARSRIEEFGHKTVVYSQFKYDTSGMKDELELLDELRRNPCDGYLIEGYWAALFDRVLPQAFPDRKMRCTYYWPGYISDNHAPMIQMDTHEAIRRAMTIFRQYGYRKPAILIHEGNSHPAEAEERCYRHALADQGLEYAEAVVIEKGMRSGNDRLAALFDRNPPDAVYTADDHFLPLLDDFLRRRGLTPGADVAVITLANAHVSHLPATVDWSRLEFDPAQIGILAVDDLLRALNMPGRTMASFSHQAAWIPGQSCPNRSASESSSTT